ncbi:hypothetical protein A0J48_013220, partial [Sphaerospermopsis aphanizomenoides BCCUSP55]|uniref:hypothetical protein n=1 Tax=Sphaerospermopsis aphanizomenoides TaxID=459663 RepID=UPI001906BBFB
MVSDIAAYSYCFLALSFSIRFIQISQKRYFFLTIILIWLSIIFFVISRIDFTYLQSFYGIEDKKFAGVYLYMGDTFSLVSMMLVSKIITINANSLKTSLICRKGKLNLRHIMLCLAALLVLLLSIIVLFFNGSRGALI